MRSELEVKGTSEPEREKKECHKYAMKVKKTKPGGGENVGIENPNKNDT